MDHLDLRAKVSEHVLFEADYLDEATDDDGDGEDEQDAVEVDQRGSQHVLIMPIFADIEHGEFPFA
jgi:hypothetical protein